ncbi:MAG: phage minor head protein [Collinsella aerofaciens]|nr:phage minor head protein [Collinsella aerofaciens]
MKIHSIDEIPTVQDVSGWKYVTNLGYTSIKSFKTSKAAAAYALKIGLYELVPDEAAESPTVTKTQHFDGFQIDTYSDGTYGYMTDGGKHKEGYKSKDGAKKAATKLAATEPKGPQVLKSEDKGGYVVNTFADGTYGCLMPDGTFKNGYKSKDGAGKAGKKLAAKAAKAQEDTQAKLLEKQAQELQEKLQLTYADAIEGMTSRIATSLKEFAAEDAKWQADVAAGKKDAKAYAAWRKGQALHNDQLKALKKALTQDLTAADKMAMAYVNQVPAGVYAEGMNFATYEIEHGAKANTSFTLYNKNTVMELVANEPNLLPQAAFDKAKDTAWNSRHVTSAVTQAVLQGQTVPQLAASIAGIAAMDQRAAMKAARTAMTSAHSLGKLKGYERAAGMGIDVEKQWLAALDSRTRGSHRHLDGETVKLDAEFSNGLKYPGDPDGPASEVYNCRCTLVPVIGGVEYDEVERANKLGSMSYEEWKAEKLTKGQKLANALDSQLKDVDNEIDVLKELMKSSDKTYSGIWKDPVTLADWDAKKDAIPKKLEYFNEKLMANNNPAVAELLQKYIDDVEDFDKQGQAYKAYIDKMSALKLKRQSIHKQMVDLGLVEDSAFSEERKANAWRFTSPEEADKHFRGVCGKVWREATKAERNGIYGYTESSGAWNRPLSGFQKPWSQPGSGWEKKFYKGPGGVWINYEGKGSAICNMTSLIEKSTYDHDAWVVRGCDYNAMESFFGTSASELEGMSTDELKSLVGMSNRIHSFVSTGAAAGKGFSSQPVAMEIFCPAGSEMMYAEPFSAYSGATNYDDWDGKKKQNYFGSEFEMILQRGGYYTVTDVYKGDDGKMHVVLELHPEQGYDKFQQDPKEWTGSKSKYK